MKLLGEERNGDSIDRYWLHPGDDGKDRITIETIQDVEPAMKRARMLTSDSKSFRHIASIPFVVITEISKINAKRWGISVREAFSEITITKTDRAKAVWKMLTEGRDFSKFQARTY